MSRRRSAGFALLQTRHPFPSFARLDAADQGPLHDIRSLLPLDEVPKAQSNPIASCGTSRLPSSRVIESARRRADPRAPALSRRALPINANDIWPTSEYRVYPKCPAVNFRPSLSAQLRWALPIKIWRDPLAITGLGSIALEHLNPQMTQPNLRALLGIFPAVFRRRLRHSLLCSDRQ